LAVLMGADLVIKSQVDLCSSSTFKWYQVSRFNLAVVPCW